MSNIEHLIENALVAASKAESNGEDSHQAFTDAMNRPHNQQMFQTVAITQRELWSIVQYILYTWIPTMDTDDINVTYLCDQKRCEKCAYPECQYTDDVRHAKNFHKVLDDFYEENETMDDVIARLTHYAK
jgi:hypothetical protein